MLAIALIVMGLALMWSAQAARNTRETYPDEPLSPGMDAVTSARTAHAKALAPLAVPLRVVGAGLVVVGAVIGIVGSL